MAGNSVSSGSYDSRSSYDEPQEKKMILIQLALEGGLNRYMVAKIHAGASTSPEILEMTKGANSYYRSNGRETVIQIKSEYCWDFLKAIADQYYRGGVDYLVSTSASRVSLDAHDQESSPAGLCGTLNKAFSDLASRKLNSYDSMGVGEAHPQYLQGCRFTVEDEKKRQFDQKYSSSFSDNFNALNDRVGLDLAYVRLSAEFTVREAVANSELGRYLLASRSRAIKRVRVERNGDEVYGFENFKLEDVTELLLSMRPLTRLYLDVTNPEKKSYKVFASVIDGIMRSDYRTGQTQATRFSYFLKREREETRPLEQVHAFVDRNRSAIRLAASIDRSGEVPTRSEAEKINKVSYGELLSIPYHHNIYQDDDRWETISSRDHAVQKAFSEIRSGVNRKKDREGFYDMNYIDHYIEEHTTREIAKGEGAVHALRQKVTQYYDAFETHNKFKRRHQDLPTDKIIVKGPSLELMQGTAGAQSPLSRVKALDTSRLKKRPSRRAEVRLSGNDQHYSSGSRTEQLIRKFHRQSKEINRRLARGAGASSGAYR